MAAAETLGAFRGGGGGCSGPERDEQELSRFVFGLVPPGGAAEPPAVRLRHRRIFEPQTGTGHLRFGGVPLHRRERPSRPRHHRHIPAAVSQGDRGAVRQGAAAGARDGRSHDGQVLRHGGRQRLRRRRALDGSAEEDAARRRATVGAVRQVTRMRRILQRSGRVGDVPECDGSRALLLPPAYGSSTSR